ncbi:interleukin-23 receptor [Cyprinodon tularosa]|uniref:interleukin-23 receptor n=1 Tax=Cyprinodon tularosa TaxID=77115 RepID=UPI0018E287C9|nr:interleukin-23 receptor [Cyprinodon tularosa]XP_038151244.1 interleukin-23 receptor [Cyprinodon tularosa]XP_038151245.1 interleukin-23 receptor [Cyprinodon tularosa]XP_038151246.1 interleukin-23 receptor [Cyprinodon tularosa]XP_038151247.1 interleukin-23 receptor [Cyprinodon tularosa]
MNLLLSSWRCIVMLLCFSISGFPLLPADCMDIIPLGYLTAEPGTLFLMGSNLTVYCHVFKCEPRCTLYLELNNRGVTLSRNVNCTTTVFYLREVWTQRSKVVCTMDCKKQSVREVVSGLDLKAGFPPDKPTDISCETTKSWDSINCSLRRGRDTYLHTLFNISVQRENETIFNVTQNGEEISIPRSIMDENTEYTLTATAYNHFGASRSDPFIFSVKDIVIPETPRIVRMEFMNDSTSAELQWESSESSMDFIFQIRLLANNSTSEYREVAEFSEGLIRLENLRPLTEYQFQIKTCASKSRQAQRSLCSKWSPSVRKKSPGKGPSQQLHVWRMIGKQTNGLKNVTVFWKPPSFEDYSGELKIYIIHLDKSHKECAAVSNHCSVQAPEGLRALSISAITSYGASPPAVVDLRHAGASGASLGKVASTADGSSVHVSWSSTVGKDLLYFIVEWKSEPADVLQWKKVDKHVKDTTITGLMAGVMYNLSLYSVTSRGVSDPASRLIYSKELKPLAAPMFHMEEKNGQILVSWDELPLHQQRGFITKYTFYWQTPDSNSRELSVMVSGSSQRQIWLDCPGGLKVIQMTASNSAGEGPQRKGTIIPPPATTVRLVVVILFTMIVFVAIVANLMCWSCVRKRIKQKCIAWGPKWLMDNLPKPGHSNAIRLLEDDRSEPLFSTIYSDPPLSPILVISEEEEEERDEVYPAIHVEESLVGSDQTPDTTTILVQYSSYKPQIAALVPLEEEANDAEEELRDVQENTEEDRCLLGFEGLLGELLSDKDLDYSHNSHQIPLCFTGDLLLPKTAATSALQGIHLNEMGGKEEDVENSVSSVDLQQVEKKTLDSDDSSSCPFSVDTIQSSGYFPQVAPLSAMTGETLR